MTCRLGRVQMLTDVSSIHAKRVTWDGRTEFAQKGVCELSARVEKHLSATELLSLCNFQQIMAHHDAPLWVLQTSQELTKLDYSPRFPDKIPKYLQEDKYK